MDRLFEAGTRQDFSRMPLAAEKHPQGKKTSPLGPAGLPEPLPQAWHLILLARAAGHHHSPSCPLSAFVLLPTQPSSDLATQNSQN